jgi:ABC-type transporter Mla subunit MlaD
MSAGQVAALIAAVFFAVGMCAAVFVLLRLGRLISEATRMLSDYRDSAGRLIDRAQAAVDRTNEQLARTDSITASMDEVTANMAELSGHVSALAGLARGISAGLGAPLLRVSALAYGIRRAVGLRRPARVSSAGHGALPSTPAAGTRRALPRQRGDASLSRREEVRR